MNLYDYQRSRSFTDLGSSRSDSTFSNFVFLETAWSVEAKFYVEPPWDEGMNLRFMSHDQDGHYAHLWYKPLNNFFPRTEGPITMKLSMQQQVLEY